MIASIQLSTWVEKQGHNECALATIAALAGVKLAAVREVALLYASEIFGSPLPSWSAIFRLRGSSLRRMLFIEGMEAACEYFDVHPGLIHNTNYYLTVPGATTVATRLKVLSKRISTLPSVGRGTIRVKTRGGSTHVMPWRDGMIHNSADQTVCTLSQYRAAYRGHYSVNRIVQIEEVVK